MVKLVEIVKQLNGYQLREVFVNPNHVISLREDCHMKQDLNEGNLPKDLDARQSFTKLILDRGSVGLELTIIGNPTTVESKLNNSLGLLNG